MAARSPPSGDRPLRIDCIDSRRSRGCIPRPEDDPTPVGELSGVVYTDRPWAKGVQRAQPSRVGDAHVYKDEGEPRGNVKPNNNSYNYTKETKRYDSDGSRHRREVRLSASGGASRNNACRVSAPYKEATRTQVRKWRRLDCPDAERICNPSATR